MLMNSRYEPHSYHDDGFSLRSRDREWVNPQLSMKRLITVLVTGVIVRIRYVMYADIIQPC